MKWAVPLLYHTILVSSNLQRSVATGREVQRSIRMVCGHINIKGNRTPPIARWHRCVREQHVGVCVCCVCEGSDESVGRWVGSCACVRRVWVGEWGRVRV